MDMIILYFMLSVMGFLLLALIGYWLMNSLDRACCETFDDEDDHE
jgi:hypothetical protein